MWKITKEISHRNCRLARRVLKNVVYKKHLCLRWQEMSGFEFRHKLDLQVTLNYGDCLDFTLMC